MTCKMLSMFPLYTSCFESFYHRWMLDCSFVLMCSFACAFSASTEISTYFLSFILLPGCNMLVDLWVQEWQPSFCCGGTQWQAFWCGKVCSQIGCLRSPLVVEGMLVGGAGLRCQHCRLRSWKWLQPVSVPLGGF